LIRNPITDEDKQRLENIVVFYNAQKNAMSQEIELAESK